MTDLNQTPVSADVPPPVALMQMMTGYTTQVSAAVDVGGGHGILLTTILQANPALQGLLFDLPHVAEETRQRLTAAGVADRRTSVGGDFFTAALPRGDAYLLKWIIHDWDDERAITLLENCHRAMPANGKLLLVEAVIPPGNTPFFHKVLDLTMLVVTGGLERTAAEHRTLLAAAGFRLTQIIPTQTEMSVIEAVRE